jgi:hypothetical protein
MHVIVITRNIEPDEGNVAILGMNGFCKGAKSLNAEQPLKGCIAEFSSAVNPITASFTL